MTIWAVVPAAGIGSRMLSATPKQYLFIRDQTVLAHTLARLSAVALIKGIVLVLSAHDSHWSSLKATDTTGDVKDTGNQRVVTCVGGETRWQSVLNGLQALADVAADDDWVLVHDGVRPCVRVADILRLLELTSGDEVGGLLAVPVSDTLKRAALSTASAGRVAGSPAGSTAGSSAGVAHVAETIDRDAMWSASTPQLFRLGLLRRCLQQAAAAGASLTDEASALEWAGYRPVLVPCHKDNIKITHPDDLRLAELILDAQKTL
jgi:2-C-methyl-D-erythritol 4-phosphate cytidylyltransferase